MISNRFCNAINNKPRTFLGKNLICKLDPLLKGLRVRKLSAIKIAFISIALFLQACASVQEHAYTGDLDAVKIYVEEGGDVDLAENSSGYWCLLVNCAIAGGRENVVRYLLDQGADVNKSYAVGTPLERAIQAANLRIVKLLIERNADVNRANQTSSLTPLMYLFHLGYAANWERLMPIADELVAAGAIVNYQSKYGQTALHYAAARNNVAGVKWLLENNVDPALKSNESLPSGKQEAAIDLARDLGHNDVVAVLAESESEHRDWDKAKLTDTLATYKNYLAAYPNGLFVDQAEQKIKALEAELELEKQARLKEFLALKRKQNCGLQDENWVYLKGGCAGKQASGQGEAVTMDGLKFVGRFENGQRIKGEIFHNNVLMFDGSISQGKPHGKAICIHEGRPESCEFYKGKRVDGVFIQRRDFAQQQQILNEQQRKIEERLALNEEKMDLMASNLKSKRGYAGQAQSGSNGVSDMLVDKATDHAVEAIFNHLF